LLAGPRGAGAHVVHTTGTPAVCWTPGSLYTASPHRVLRTGCGRHGSAIVRLRHRGSARAAWPAECTTQPKACTHTVARVLPLDANSGNMAQAMARISVDDSCPFQL